MKFLWILSFIISCSQGTIDEGSISYYLERVATSQTENTLYLSYEGDNLPGIIVEGNGIEISLPSGLMIALPQQVDLSVQETGIYTIKLSLYHDQQVPYLEDSLDWEYSLEVPPAPNVKFSERASNDQDISLVISQDKGLNTNQVWIEGDLEAPGDQGAWYDIPVNGLVPIRLSAGDGPKHLTLHYRNIFDIEGPSSEASVILKSTPPEACAVYPVSSTISDLELEFNLDASDDILPVEYRVTGDVMALKDFQSFTPIYNGTETLSFGSGSKDITFHIRDVAGNECPPFTFQITVDEGHSPAGLEFKDQSIWTNSPSIILKPRFDNLNDDVTMIVAGDVLDTDSTFQEIAYDTEVNVTLTAHEGTRHVLIRYFINGEEQGNASNHIYLSPFVKSFDFGVQKKLILSRLIETESIDITGCIEPLVNQSFASEYLCTPMGASIDVTFNFTDGTSLEINHIF